MAYSKSTYHNTYIQVNGQFVSLAEDTMNFCEKWIKPVHKENWNWAERDFTVPANDPKPEEARVIANLIYEDLKQGSKAQVDLSKAKNVEALKDYFNPKSKAEKFNMEQFAYALKVELEHGRLKEVNVTNNHPFLTAMIVIAHMSETLTYYERLEVMEAEGNIYELIRKLKTATSNKSKLLADLQTAELNLIDARKKLATRFEYMDSLAPMQDVSS